MCGFMRPLGLPKRRAGSNSFIALIAVTWACFKSGCARSSMRCAKDCAFQSVSAYPSTRSQRHNRRTDFLYGSKLFYGFRSVYGLFAVAVLIYLNASIAARPFVGYLARGGAAMLLILTAMFLDQLAAANLFTVLQVLEI